MNRSVVIAIALLVALTGAVPVLAMSTWSSKVDASVLKAVESGDAEFIVYMAAKADLSDAKLLASKASKGTFVYKALNDTARVSQAPVLALLRDLDAPAESFWISNSIVTKGNLDVLEAVAQRADVKAI